MSSEDLRFRRGKFCTPNSTSRWLPFSCEALLIFFFMPLIAWSLFHGSDGIGCRPSHTTVSWKEQGLDEPTLPQVGLCLYQYLDKTVLKMWFHVLLKRADLDTKFKCPRDSLNRTSSYVGILPYVWPQFTTPKLKPNLTWLLVGQPTFFIVVWTSLSSELVHATIKIVMAPYLVGPTFGFN